MSGKKGVTRKATVKDPAKLKSDLARMAKKYGWSVSEFSAYCLRMGVNRCLALERYKPAAVKKTKPRKAQKRVSNGVSHATNPGAA